MEKLFTLNFQWKYCKSPFLNTQSNHIPKVLCNCDESFQSPSHLPKVSKQPVPVTIAFIQIFPWRHVHTWHESQVIQITGAKTWEDNPACSITIIQALFNNNNNNNKYKLRFFALLPFPPEQLRDDYTSPPHYGTVLSPCVPAEWNLIGFQMPWEVLLVLASCPWLARHVSGVKQFCQI